METGLVRFLVSVWFGNIWRIFLNEEPVVLRDGENIYGDRYQLRTDFADDIFTLIIFNATYNDSGFGKCARYVFFSYCQWLNYWRKVVWKEFLTSK